MAVQATLQLGIRNFSQNLKQARNEVRKETSAMKSDASGVGASLTRGLSGAAAAVGATASVAGVLAGIKGSLQFADDIADLSEKLNESAETLQRVDFVAQQTASVGIDQVTKAMLKLERNLGDIENTRVADALGRIGISAGDLVGLPLDEKLIALSEGFQEARRTGVGLADLQDLLGRSGQELIPLLNQSGDALREMFEGAPAMADEMITKMAIMNDQFDAVTARAKMFGMETVGALGGIAQFLGDVFETGSIDEAFLREGERQVEAAKRIRDKSEAKSSSAEAVEASREQVEVMREQETAAKAVADALDRVNKIKEKMAEDELKLLPPEAQVDALKEKLDGIFSGSVDNLLGNFDRSTEGLEALVTAREGMENLPAEGENSVLEAVEWLQEARALEAEIAALQASQAKAEADRAKAEQDRLTKLREQAEKGEFRLMDPAEQAAELRKQLSESLGIEIDGAADIEDGLKKLRDRADRAREQGDTEGEAVLRERIIAAQEDAQGLAALAEQLGDGAAPAGGGEVGALGQLFNQVFGRSKEEILIDEQRRANESAERRNRTLDKILEKMDDPPEPNRFGFDE